MKSFLEGSTFNACGYPVLVILIHPLPSVPKPYVQYPIYYINIYIYTYIRLYIIFIFDWQEPTSHGH